MQRISHISAYNSLFQPTRHEPERRYGQLVNYAAYFGQRNAHLNRKQLSDRRLKRPTTLFLMKIFGQQILKWSSNLLKKIKNAQQPPLIIVQTKPEKPKLPAISDQSCSMVSRNFAPLLLTKLSQRCNILGMSGVNCSLEVMPNHRNQVEVRTLGCVEGVFSSVWSYSVVELLLCFRWLSGCITQSLLNCDWQRDFHQNVLLNMGIYFSVNDGKLPRP